VINQVLNREFILDQMKQTRKYLALPGDERRRGASPPDEAKELRITDDDKRAALEELEKSLAKEQKESTGQSPNFKRRGAEPPLDDWSFFSRDPIISNFQTVMDYYFSDGPGKDQVKLDPPPASDRRGPGEVPVAGNTSISGYAPKTSDGRRVFDKFSVTDPEWVSTALAVGVRLLRDPKAFNPNAPVVPVANKLRMVVVGDWGSGIERAQKVAKCMSRAVKNAPPDYQVHVMHLGDTYYSGWKREYQKRFLPYWPVTPEEHDRVFSWSLNGNHDMYSGGQGYFDFLLKDPRFAKQAKASFFCLENDNWQIFGLDSSHKDGGLREPQADWVKARIDSNKKTMFLTHHQPFSSYESPALAMLDELKPAIAAAAGGKLKAWLWGHEHRFMLFHETQYVSFGRLIGHGGVPVYMTHPADSGYPEPGMFEDRRFLPKTLGLEHWAYFGFAVLDFTNDTIHSTYFNEDGEQSYPNASFPNPDIIT
jgi:hypothetical protein